MVSESCFHSVLHRKSLTYVRHRKPFIYCTESPLKTAQCTVLANCPMGSLDTAQCTVQSESFSYCIESTVCCILVCTSIQLLRKYYFLNKVRVYQENQIKDNNSYHYYTIYQGQAFIHLFHLTTLNQTLK